MVVDGEIIDPWGVFREPEPLSDENPTDENESSKSNGKNTTSMESGRFSWRICHDCSAILTRTITLALL